MVDRALVEVVVRRADGMPLPMSRPGRYGSVDRVARTAQSVTAGSLIGPIAPGALRIEVAVGRVPLDTVEVVIQSDRIMPLRLPVR